MYKWYVVDDDAAGVAVASHQNKFVKRLLRLGGKFMPDPLQSARQNFFVTSQHFYGRRFISFSGRAEKAVFFYVLGEYGIEALLNSNICF